MYMYLLFYFSTVRGPELRFINEQTYIAFIVSLNTTYLVSNLLLFEDKLWVTINAVYNHYVNKTIASHCGHKQLA